MISSLLKCRISFAEVFLVPGSLIYSREKYERSKGKGIRTRFYVQKDTKNWNKLTSSKGF